MRLGAYLRSLDPGLPRPVWLLQAGGLANAFGNGLAFPFLLIYLHNVRGISLSLAGLAVGINAFAALLCGPFAGSLVDRIGARPTLAISLVFLAVGFGGLPLVEEPWHAFALSAVAGIGNGGFWPSQSALVTALTPRNRTHAAFGMQRVTNNLGIGLGAIAGGLIARTEDVSTFVVLFGLDAATFLVFLAVLKLVPSPPRARGEHDLPGTYRDVFANRVAIAVLALNAAFVAVGYGVVELIPVYAKNEASVSELGVSLVFFVNTMTIVVVQLFVVKASEGRRRMPALALMGVLWAASWLLVPVAGISLEGAEAVALISVAAAIFGIGECLHGAVQGALVADLAPRRLLGRYMALSATSWQIGLTLGPAIGGIALDFAPHQFWVATAVACLAVSALAFAVERALPHSARRTPARTAVATVGGS